MKTQLERLMDDCLLEIEIQKQCERIKEEGSWFAQKIMQQRLQELVSMRSEEQKARMERDRLQKALKQ